MAMGALLSIDPELATDVQPQDAPSENVAIASNAMLFLSQHPRLEPIRTLKLKADEMPTIETYSVNVVVAGKYAHITTELTVRGHDKKRFSGDLVLPLPQEALLTGYAVLLNHDSIHNQMVEAIAVPSRSIDELGLENTTYIDEMAPIPTSGYADHEFRIALSQVTSKSLTPVRVNYMIPLDDNGVGSDLYIPLPDAKLKERNIHITVDGKRVEQPKSIDGMNFEKANDNWLWNEYVQNAAPEKYLHFIIPAVVDESSVVHRSLTSPDKSHFVIHIKDKGTVQTGPHDLSKMRIIWDDSRMLDEESVRAARRVIELIPEKGNYELITFSGGVNAAQQFTTRDDLLHYIDSLHYDGQMLLDDIMPAFKAPYNGMKLVFTNGMFWSNDEVFEPMNDIAVIVSGKLAKTERLRNAGARLYDLNETSAEAVVQNLKAMGSSGVSVTGQHISELQIAGDYIKGELTILGELSAITDDVTVSLNGKSHIFHLSSGSAPSSRILESAWAFAKMRALAELPKAELNVVRLSQKYALPTAYTKLVVLDQLKQYNSLHIVPPEHLTEIHSKYCKTNDCSGQTKHKLKEWSDIAKDLYAMDLSNTETENPDDEVESPDDNEYDKPIYTNTEVAINKGIQFKQRYDEYICNKSSVKDCTPQDYTEVAHRSEYGIHYIEPFTAPKNWTCTSEMHCGGATLPERTPYYRSDYEYCRSFYSGVKDLNNVTTFMVSSYPEPSKFTKEVEVNVSFTGQALKCDNTDHEQSAFEIAEKAKNTAIPYLDSYRSILNNGGDWNAVYDEYIKYRKKGRYKHNLPFYFESADFFARHQKMAIARRILSNLMLYEQINNSRKIWMGTLDDQFESLSRKHFRRLLDYGQLDAAIQMMSYTPDLYEIKLDAGEDNDDANVDKSSIDDLVLLLEYAEAFEKRARRDKRLSDALMALKLYKITYSSAEGSAYNNLKAWVMKQRWSEPVPKIADHAKTFEADLRIVMNGPLPLNRLSWLGIVEPSSELVMEAHRVSLNGGILIPDMNNDIYINKNAPAGVYAIYAFVEDTMESWFTSDVPLSVTVYRNWGRSNQSEQTLLLRVSESELKKLSYVEEHALTGELSDYQSEGRLYKIGSIVIK